MYILYGEQYCTGQVSSKEEIMQSEDCPALRTSIRCFSKDLHLSLVRLAGQMALEAILVPALLLAHLAVPSQLLQSL